MYYNIIKLCRLNNPIPIIGLYLPCLWGIAWAQYYLKYPEAIKNIIFFAIASIITRTLGCIINDIVDKDIDKYVRRTKTRVLATGELSLWVAYLMIFFLGTIGFYMLFWLKPLAVFFALCGAIGMIIYPFTKRFLKRPQIVLGIAWNMGLLVAYTNISNRLSLSVFIVYIASIYWIVYYDTIYAYQDIEDDLKLNINSTAIIYQDNPKYYMRTLLSMMMLLLFVAGFIDSLSANWFYYCTIFLCIGFMLRILTFTNLNDTISCRNSFRANIFIGFIILVAIYFGR